jgi:hypothetical protein
LLILRGNRRITSHVYDFKDTSEEKNAIQAKWVIEKWGEANMCEDKSPSSAESDATFLGWQKTRSGKPIALYNVTAANHPSRGSTVTETSLHKLNLQVPGTPVPQKAPSSQQDDQRER